MACSFVLFFFNYLLDFMEILTPKQISQVIKIKAPLEWNYVTQPFAVNWANFYQQFGLKGHNGLDLRADDSTPCYACFDGEVLWADDWDGYGINVWIKTAGMVGNPVLFELEAIYGHLKKVAVQKGQKVFKGDIVGWSDNTGKYTTGNHLHFGVRPKYGFGYEDNGYGGWIDPSELFEDKGWDLLPVEKRYLRFYKPEDPKWRPWHAYQSEIKVLPTLLRRLKRFPINQEMLAIVYGGWDFDSVFNPGMWPIWATLKKDEYLAGKKPPLRLSV